MQNHNEAGNIKDLVLIVLVCVCVGHKDICPQSGYAYIYEITINISFGVIYLHII